MTDKEIIRAEVKRRVEKYRKLLKTCRKEEYEYFKGELATAEQLLLFIDSMPEDPVYADLEEEAEKYLEEHIDGGSATERTGFKTWGKYIARHFAAWQKDQMMKNTADAMIGLPYENKDGGYTHIVDVSRPLPVGNNKIAIIFKED